MQGLNEKLSFINADLAADTFKENFLILNGDALEKSNEAYGLAVTKEIDLENLMEIILNKNLDSLVSIHSFKAAEIITACSRILHAKTDFFTNPNFVLLDEDLKKEQAWSVTGENLNEVFDSVIEFVDNSTNLSRISERILGIAKELCNNSIRAHAEKSLSQPIGLSFGVGQNFLSISCVDQAGTLDSQKVLELIQKQIQREWSSSINPGESGLGSYLILKQVTSYVLAVQPGNKTLVSVLMPLQVNPGLRDLYAPSLHQFVF